jgi:hypothetical protein
MKTLKNYTLVLIAIVFSSTISYGQIVLASSKKKKDKEKEETTATTKTETPGEEVKQEEPKEEEKTFTLSGSVDTYFHSSFGTQNAYPFDGDGNPAGTYAPNTSFADGKGFALGMVNLIAAYQGEKAGFVGDVVFGPRGRAAVFGTASGQAIVNQLYAYYKFSDAVTINLGQFNTFLGYEVISPAINFHYSTSYLFSWGPFNHTGARADFAFGDGFVAKVAVMNPTDIVEFNPVNTYTLGGQIGYANDNGGVWLNVLSGDQDGKLDTDKDPIGASSAGKLFQWDITTSWNLGESFSIGLNTSMQSTGKTKFINPANQIVDAPGAETSSFFGVAVYPKLTLSESFALGFRAEYFAIKKAHLDIIGLDEDDNGNVIEFTLSGNYKVGGLTFIPEFRIDKTSEDSFYTIENRVASPKSLLATVNLAAVYKF